MKNYYKILCISPSATQQQIKIAYRERAREHHPDVSPDKSGLVFKEIQEAYHILSNPNKRRDYDTLFKLGHSKSALAVSTMLSLDALYMGQQYSEYLNHTHKPHNSSEETFYYKNGDVTFDLYLSSNEASHGLTIELSIPVQIRCASCKGEKYILHHFPCDTCHGTGVRHEVFDMKIPVPAGVSNGQVLRFPIKQTHQPISSITLVVTVS